MAGMAATYRLTRAGRGLVEAPVLDAAQRRVVDHTGGPLLVLAGPGTGKTTTLVETVVDRVERRDVDPSRVLVLTFSRKAAQELRDRIAARLGRTLASPVASTCHSFAYGLVRREATARGDTQPLQLLSAPQADGIVRELLHPSPESVAWPDALRHARGTRGFVNEVQAVMARARERGLGVDGLAELAEAAGRPAWEATATFLGQYLDVMAIRGQLDYPEIVGRAVELAERPDAQADLRAAYDLVVVDEYQDTDPSQVRLLQALAGDGGNLIAVGDPDQSIYAFRGADVTGILNFPTEFPQRDGSPADVLALETTRRFGPLLLGASRHVLGGLGQRGAIDRAAFEAFRSPRAQSVPDADPEHLVVRTYDTPRAEGEHLADLLRRAHLEDGLAWSDMAVLVRSGVRGIPAIRRALVGAGVPVEVAADETPLSEEPAVRTLVDALRVGETWHTAGADAVTAEDARGLLTSQLGRLDASDQRALARALRARARQQEPDVVPPGSDQLLRRALVEPAVLDDIEAPGAARVRSMSSLMGRVVDEIARARAGSSSVELVLWEAWSGTDWPSRLQTQARSPGTPGRLANRDLDAVCALFDLAARGEEAHGHRSVSAFVAELDDQQIPADSLAEHGVRGDAVRLMTAHRSKGLEWELVAVCQVQEGSWPDTRVRSSLLEPDRIGARADELLPRPTVASLVREERRLFYVACTRARRRLVVTAVRSELDDGDQPSRFLRQLGVEPEHVLGRPEHPLSLAGMVAGLRRLVCDPATADDVRHAAADRLAALSAVEGVEVPGADPAHWWGVDTATESDVPVRPPDEPLQLSASALETLEACPLKWFLERQAGGSTTSTSAQGFGLVVHAIAERVARGELTTVAEAEPYIDEVWEALEFQTPWASQRGRAEVTDMLHRFLDWHQQVAAQRELVATEQQLDALVDLPDGDRVALHGYADRLERQEDGTVVVVDLKTGKTKPADKDLDTNAQLGFYQLAVEAGALDGLLGERVCPGGAELVQLREARKSGVKVQRQAPLPPPDDGPRVVELQLQRAVSCIRAEEFEARPSDLCRLCSFRTFCPAQREGTVLG